MFVGHADSRITVSISSMSFLNLSPEDFISGGIRTIKAGLQGGNIVVTTARPALEKYANLMAQASINLLYSNRALVSVTKS